MWQAMPKALNEDGVVASPHQCDSKYRNLLATYKEKKDKAQRSGNNSKKWTYIELMDEIHGFKANIDPQHLQNAGSLPGSTSSSSNSSLNLSDCSNSGDKQAQPESAKGKGRQSLF